MDDIYCNKTVIMNRKQKYIKAWIITLGLVFILFIVFSLFHPINQYKTYLGHVRKDVDNYVVLYLKDFEIPNIQNATILDRKFEILSVSEDYYLINNSNYYMVCIKMDLKKEELINNNIINVVIKYNETTLFKLLKKGLV